MELQLLDKPLLEKEFEDEDPMRLVGMVLPGEPGQLEAMAACLLG
jgi:hypothetical protein